MKLAKEAEVTLEAARRAIEAIMAIYATEFGVSWKGVNDPVTAADRAANTILEEAIHAAFPDDTIVAEESPVPADFASKKRCWFVDPLDGTKEFVARNGEFCTMVGLAIDGRAALGVIGVPALPLLGESTPGYFMIGEVGGEAHAIVGARSRALRFVDDDRLETAVVSRSHRSPALAAVLARLGAPKERTCGSVGAKVGKLVTGEVDAYVHPGRGGKRWDVCAPEAIVRAAGGVFTDGRGLPFDYADGELENRHGLAASKARLHSRLLDALSVGGRESPGA